MQTGPNQKKPHGKPVEEFSFWLEDVNGNRHELARMYPQTHQFYSANECAHYISQNPETILVTHADKHVISKHVVQVEKKHSSRYLEALQHYSVFGDYGHLLNEMEDKF